MNKLHKLFLKVKYSAIYKPKLVYFLLKMRQGDKLTADELHYAESLAKLEQYIYSL